ncbi:hypothetical protein GIB67_042999 [Kingdonia uniflora]|uniref:Pentatricopeptide repeat-containing protein n=1 Tax=Kingdonia uniflora TaxID=39325 RepID=A0A7J7NT25_9MAGN|nr:hypothetical protein GIB67_042999 [Kingdonia uniflora]
MPVKDIVSWNAIITGYWQNGFIEESKRLFGLMPVKNVVSWNSMITGCIENERIDEACEYFMEMPERNTASWNAMISGFVKEGRVDEALRLFEEMPNRNVISYTVMVDGYARKGEVDRARYLFDWIPRKNEVSWTVMINGYVENERFDEARALFDMMPEKSLVAITAMITGFCKEGMMEDAKRLFEEIHHRDLVAWNAMIAGYAQNGNAEEAFKLYLQMLKMGMKPDRATLISILTSCSSVASLKGGRQTHAFVIKKGLEPDISLCNALMSMYSKCGDIHESKVLFEQLHSPDLVSWNTIITAFGQHGHCEKAVDLFHEMCEHGLKPDGVTFLCVLSACGHAGKVNESINWYDSMVNEYQIAPRAEHFACLVDILCRAGQLVKAHTIIKEMPFEADAGIWGSLLTACGAYLNVELGELAAMKLVELEPGHSGTYIMLSNIYAAAGMWREVGRVRGLMKEQGVKKEPGCSWVETGNRVHLFKAGDVSHPEISEIVLELRRIGLQMKMSDDYEDIVLG